ncbi:unnamed protein product [Angiostrongylus costaricensis]|uniref:Uncharacterized protein n=1 Tax=Angiostrongylus costaricensis TaxID=334426 RepID=A0A0R3PDP6_ANGCS|nr:unnamed protein product [Angiostrongylus costaricensis]
MKTTNTDDSIVWIRSVFPCFVWLHDFDLCETYRESCSQEQPMEQIKPVVGAEIGDSRDDNHSAMIQVTCDI